MMLENSEVYSSQIISVLSAAAPRNYDFDPDKSTTDEYINAISYL